MVGGVSDGGDGAALDQPAAVAETHSGIVVFLGDRAFKLKKPLDLGFVDYTTVEARRAACEAEVALNRRLAPEVYLGVGSLRHEGHDEPVVVMRRLPEDRRLAHLLTDGTDVEPCVRHLAHRLAAFHAGADRTPVADQAASSEATLARWEDNAREMEGMPSRTVDERAASEVLDEARTYLSGRQRLLDHRIACGRARDGHGDLLAQDIFCLDEGPAVLDCLEFDPALRAGDVLADVAFLAMDVERLGRPDIAWAVLDLHRELLDDDWPRSLAHHHIAYRAQVRAKVAGIRAAQGAPITEDPRLLLALAAHHLRSARVRLVVAGGLPGSGKSTVAAAVADHLGAVVLRSDETRKELVGLAAHDPAGAAPGEGIYDAAHSTRTYDEVLARARLLLEMGESVVVDATFSQARWREEARDLAAATSARCVELRCVAPVSVCEARVAQRAEGPTVSDADPQVVRAMASTFAEWPEATEVSTTRPLAASVAHALESIDPDPPGP